MANKASAVLKAQFGNTDPFDQNTDLVDSLGTAPDGTTTVKGKVELATDAEALALTSDVVVLTPGNLGAVIASATQQGIVELATDAETQTGTDATRAVTPASLAATTATATRAGVVELATSAETITGTDDARAVTPADLAALTTTATRAGLVELATDAEAKTGTDTARAVTAANLRAVLTGIKTISFDGRNNVGACTATGAVAGMKVLGVFGMTSGALGNAAASFETTITVNDQIQQSAVGDLSLNDYTAILLAVA